MHKQFFVYEKGYTIQHDSPCMGSEEKSEQVNNRHGPYESKREALYHLQMIKNNYITNPPWWLSREVLEWREMDKNHFKIFLIDAEVYVGISLKKKHKKVSKLKYLSNS
ncbi:MAG: hypothetical protein M3Q64_01555 [bacterium]|nr:hypothetical protein [bacterium]